MNERVTDVVVLAMVVFTGLLYLPTLGIGEIGQPNTVATALQILPALVAAARALRALIVSTTTPTRATVLLVASGLWMSLTALQGPDILGGGVRGVWFAAVALVIGHAVLSLGTHRTLTVMVATTVVFIGLGVLLDPIADVRISTFDIVIEQSIFPWPRLRGLGANQAVLGYAGAMVIISAVSMRARFGVAFGTVAVVAGAVGVLASHNRSAIGIAVIGCGINLWRERSRLTAAAIGVSSLALSGALLTPSVFGVFDRANAASTAVDYYGGGGDGFLTGRPEVWEMAIDHAMARPLTGRGNGSFSALTAESFERLSTRWDATHAHNVIIELFVDQGVVGVLVFLAAMVATVRGHRHWPPGGYGIFVAFVVHSIFETLVNGSPESRWQFLALLAAASRQPHHPTDGGEADRDRVDHEHAFDIPAPT